MRVAAAAAAASPAALVVRRSPAAGREVAVVAVVVLVLGLLPGRVVAQLAPRRRLCRPRLCRLALVPHLAQPALLSSNG